MFREKQGGLNAYTVIIAKFCSLVSFSINRYMLHDVFQEMKTVVTTVMSFETLFLDYYDSGMEVTESNLTCSCLILNQENNFSSL